MSVGLFLLLKIVFVTNCREYVVLSLVEKYMFAVKLRMFDITPKPQGQKKQNLLQSTDNEKY